MYFIFLYVYSGLSVPSNGILATGGMTIDNHKTFANRIIQLTGGMTVFSGGVKITEGNVEVVDTGN